MDIGIDNTKLEELMKDPEKEGELIEELKKSQLFLPVIYPENSFDIDEYLKVYEMELDRLKNTIYSINLGDEKYNFTLDGEEIAKDICPDCKNTVQEFKFDTLDEKCPRCGGKHILFRIGCNYD